MNNISPNFNNDTHKQKTVPAFIPAWYETALALQIAGIILLTLTIIRISGSDDSLELLKFTGPEGALLLVFLAGFAARKYVSIMRNLPLLLVFVTAGAMLYQTLLGASIIDWVMLASFGAATVLLAVEVTVGRLLGSKGFWAMILANTFLLVWLYFDRMIFSVGRTHLSMNHLVQLMHVAEEVKAALKFFEKGHVAVFFELLLFVASPVPVARLLMGRVTRAPRTLVGVFAVILIAVAVSGVHLLRFDSVCRDLSVFQYLPLRLDLGMLPVPDHPALRNAPALAGLLQRQISLDEKKLFPENRLSFRPGFKPVNLVMISVESLRKHEFDTLMADTGDFARRGLWLDNHFSVSNITFSSFHNIFRSSFPLNLAYTGHWLTQIPLQKLLESVGYTSLLIAPERINMPQTNFWGSRAIEVKAEPKWQNTPLVLEKLLDTLREPGFKAVHAYLYNLHYNYYYPPQWARFAPVIPEEINLFLMQPDGENLAGLRNRYANSALHTDRVLADFLRQAEADGRFADTLFVVFGDHGESLGESGFIAHATGPHIKQFETTVFFVGAGVSPQKIDQPTTHADLLPIICDLMGIEVENTFGSGLNQEKKYPVLHMDEAVSGRIVVRYEKYMSVFDLSDRGVLKWLATVSNDFAIDESVAGLYLSEDFAGLAEVIERDSKFIEAAVAKN